MTATLQMTIHYDRRNIHLSARIQSALFVLLFFGFRICPIVAASDAGRDETMLPIVFATESCLGGGFDLPELTALFMAVRPHTPAS